MTKKRLMTVLCLIVLAAGALIFSKQAEGTSPTPPTNSAAQEAAPAQPPAATIPQHVVYDLLFREIVAFRSKATAEERQGREGGWFRAYHQRRGGLNEQQGEALAGIAVASQRRVAILDRQAKEIIDAARARHPNGRLNEGETLPAPPEELGNLQQQRNTVILRAVEQLRAALGPAQFQRFNEFVQQDIASRVRPLQGNERRPSLPNDLPHPQPRR